MEFEWDENKRLSNLRDHGVDFIDVVELFDGRPVFTYYSPRNDEDRWGTVGLLKDNFYLVVWTKRNGRTRIISAYTDRPVLGGDALSRAVDRLHG
jgi:uncharacterized DUF497 family protein